MKWGLMGSNSATIWSSISTGFANLWSNQDLPRGKSTSDCQFHFLPPSLFENTYPLFASILQRSKREFVLLKKTYSISKNVQKENLHIFCVCIHTSMFKKRIYSVQKNISYIKKMFKKRIYTYPVFAFILQCSKSEFTL